MNGGNTKKKGKGKGKGAIHWMFLIPGHVYASDVYASSEAEARAWYRKRYGYLRLPNGTQVWRKVDP